MDEITIHRARNGDPQAFEALATPCERMVWSVCWKMMQQREDAEDAAQETMLKAYQSIASWRGDASFSTWIYHIAVTTCMDALRKRKVRASSSLDHLKDEGFDPPSGQMQPSEEVEKKAEKEQLQQALETEYLIKHERENPGFQSGDESEFLVPPYFLQSNILPFCAYSDIIDT